MRINRRLGVAFIFLTAACPGEVPERVDGGSTGIDAPFQGSPDASVRADGPITATPDAAVLDARPDALGPDAANSCSANGQPGTCITTTACAAMAGMMSVPGHCPGATNIQCCVAAMPFGSEPFDATAQP